MKSQSLTNALKNVMSMTAICFLCFNNTAKCQEAKLDQCRITTIKGHSYNLQDPRVRYYYGNTQYWYSNATNYNDLASESGHLIVIQSWLFPHIDTKHIESIIRVSKESLPKDGDNTQENYKGIFGQQFELDLYDPIFHVKMKDGRQFYANMEGTLKGVAYVGSLKGSFSSNISDISRIDFNPDGSGSIELDTGEKKDKISEITISKRMYDRYDYEIHPYLRAVFDRPQKRGGVTVDIEAGKLGTRILSFIHSETESKAVGEKVFRVEGFSSQARYASLGWIRSGAETYTCDLEMLWGESVIDGIKTTLILNGGDIQSFRIGGQNGKLIITELHTTSGFAINSVSNCSFWYDDAASHYNDSDEKSSFKYRSTGVDIDVPLSSVTRFSTNAKGDTEIELRTGEKHTGQIFYESGKPYAIVGKLKDGLEGFDASATIILDQIREFEAVPEK